MSNVDDVYRNSLSHLMNATSSAEVDMEDREAQTSYTDSLLTTMRQVHSQIEQLEVGRLTVVVLVVILTCLLSTCSVFTWPFSR